MDNVVVITGRKGVGKDTLVDYFVKHHKTKFKHIQKICFGDELKKLANNLFPWCPLNPSHEEKDAPIKHPQNVNNLTPREIWLLMCGIDRGKNLVYIDPMVLLNQTINRWMPRIQAEKDTLFIFADLRFPWEYIFVTDNKFDIIKIVDGVSDTRDDEENIIATFKACDVFYNFKTESSKKDFTRMMETFCEEKL